MVILGLSGAGGHDPSAVLVVDGKIIAAAEEERFNRIKHSRNLQPEMAARWCLEFAGLEPSDVQVVACPFARIPLLTSPARWQFALRHGYAPGEAVTAVFDGNRRYRQDIQGLREMLPRIGISPPAVRLLPFHRHLAHAASAFYGSGWERAAVMSLHGNGEYVGAWLGYGDERGLHRVKEWYSPDSLGSFYGAIAEYLGFETLDGEARVMAMAARGNPDKADISRCLCWGTGDFRVNNELVNVIAARRYRDGQGRECSFSPELVKLWGPPRPGEDADEPYVHVAAAAQRALEEAALSVARHHLAGRIAETQRLCFAGGVAFNARLNRRLAAETGARELFVPPPAGSCGTALGAAWLAAKSVGDKPQPMEHAYLGPHYSDGQVRAALEKHRVSFEQPASITDAAAALLARGELVAWFQGRMEFGPRALGNRSVLGNPVIPGIARRVNAQIGRRERWQPFGLSVLDWAAPEVFQSPHPSPWMSLALDVTANWRDRIADVIQADGAARAQIVTEPAQPRLYELMRKFYAQTGVPMLLNTSFNRQGEPIVCTPDDALTVFFGSDVQYLVMENFLVRKTIANS
ncbi:MAG: carbamoyltransferase [Verrucomicrobia bacterium]|nr:carbamoyltransferase [Verrucomicrobiota bacterium]